MHTQGLPAPRIKRYVAWTQRHASLFYMASRSMCPMYWLFACILHNSDRR